MTILNIQAHHCETISGKIFAEGFIVDLFGISGTAYLIRMHNKKWKVSLPHNAEFEPKVMAEVRRKLLSTYRKLAAKTRSN